ncbi:MAG: hypothetical protein HOV82_17025 [Streptomyces sp.]|nr:hypothetical protein [Streptomyces sp.]NUP36206.1 hypothetical protein [Streptomyces sp.]NUS75553.1 hypothetical protein [Streptomyces sp.]
MGFREPSTIKLVFEPGDEYHGLEVTVRSMSISAWLQSSGLDGGEGDGPAATVRRFYEHLVAWNLEDERGQPVPVADAPNRDARMIRRLNNAWMEALTGVHRADPLPDSSTSGGSSPAPAIPMAPLSNSQAS